MTAAISRLRTRREREADGDATQLRLLLTRRPDLLQEHLTTRVIARLDQREPSIAGWEFLQVSPAQNKAVIQWLAKNSRQPINAMQLWAELLDNMRRENGVIALTRDELATAVGVTPAEVSRIMGELEKGEAIIRWREKVPGMRGPGLVRYQVNPNVATRLTGQARDQAQAKAPPKAGRPRLVSSTPAP